MGMLRYNGNGCGAAADGRAGRWTRTESGHIAMLDELIPTGVHGPCIGDGNIE
jgi:hypothetical protein